MMVASNTTNQLLMAIDSVMTTGGFIPVQGALTVSGIPFEVVRAYTSGPGFLDLVIVIDATEGTESQLKHGYWLIERIASALDQARSPISLTAVVMHNASAARVPTEDFLRHGRVLLVTDPTTVTVELAPILPIVLDATAEANSDPLGALVSGIGTGKDAQTKRELAEAAQVSPDVVQSVFVAWINDAFVSEGAEDD